MEQAGQISGTAHLTAQPGKMINFIHEEISDHMELNGPAFTINLIAILVDQPIERDIMLFWAYTC